MKNVNDSVESQQAPAEVMQTAGERAMHVKATVTEEAGRALESVKAAAISQIDRQKTELVSSIHSVDQALRETSRKMENSALAPQVEKVADALSSAHHFLERHNVEDLATSARRLSLRNPVVFYTGIFALGFAAGRFLSSTESFQAHGSELEINLLDAAPETTARPSLNQPEVLSHGYH